ncbi:hypothetical protein HZY88_07505 [Aerococcaceae bacterium DSM 111176]|nr:hypothetical protein [Aerococcaceae bacterium DSM 111176]
MGEQLRAADIYNKKFSKYGWIVHETLDLEVIINAVEKFESVGFDEAEKVILNYYEDRFKTVKKYIFISKHFNTRKRIFELAYADFLEGRYYASIPLTLMMIDGVLNDLKLKGFSASDEDYEVWDSISGHSSGLKQIHKIYTKSIRKTMEDTVLPHRHGILHGRILNYDNEKLAIKCLALIIYIFDWIQSFNSEDYRKSKFLEENSNTFSIEDVVNHQNKMKKHDEYQKKWEEIKVKEIYYNKSDLEGLIKGTPEYEFMNFINNLNEKKYGLNNVYIPLNVRERHKKGHLSGKIRQEFEDFLPITVEKLYVENRGSATSTLKANLTYKSNYELNKEVEREIEFLMVYQDSNGEPENRLIDKGQWVIMQMFGKKFEMR